MKIAIACDHKAVSKKNIIIDYLKKQKYEVADMGTMSTESVDYPVYAFSVAESISNKNNDLGILLCGTGIGMSIAANKVKGIRCAKVNNANEAKLTREHNDANIIALSSVIDDDIIIDIVKTFIDTNFSNDERHNRRIEMIDNYDN